MKIYLVGLLVSVVLLIAVEGWRNRRKSSQKNTTGPNVQAFWCCKNNRTCQAPHSRDSHRSRKVQSCFRTCRHCLKFCLGVPPGYEAQMQAKMCLGYR
uniref:Pancreatic trypsin inhibitor n=1 Tax=Rhipicephalus zambeziensis TaxID=60191 RepID=A0A224Y9M2_9ACAR